MMIDGDGRPSFTLDFVLPRFRPCLSQTPGFLRSHDPPGSPENTNKCLIKCGENNWDVNINLVEKMERESPAVPCSASGGERSPL